MHIENPCSSAKWLYRLWKDPLLDVSAIEKRVVCKIQRFIKCAPFWISGFYLNGDFGNTLDVAVDPINRFVKMYWHASSWAPQKLHVLINGKKIWTVLTQNGKHVCCDQPPLTRTGSRFDSRIERQKWFITAPGHRHYIIMFIIQYKWVASSRKIWVTSSCHSSSSF